MDKIRILNLRIPAKHGVYEFEKEKEEIFEVDIELYFDLSKSIKSDRLEDTVDYNDIVGLVTKIFTEKDYNLIETVAGKICNYLLEAYPIEKVIVRIRKPHAPIQANIDTVEVEIERKK